MDKPLVSAVIITYNQEEYIEQTIKCALAQKVDFNYEIIIGEDCSTDRTREICLLYQEKYPEILRVITSDKNVGLLDNWHRSVKAAKGKYIAGCGGDDYWHCTDKTLMQVDFLEKNPDYGMVHSANDFYIQDTKKLKKTISTVFEESLIENNIDLLRLILNGKYQITASTAVFKKIFFDNLFNIEEIKKQGFLMEDTPFWIELSQKTQIHYMKESLATYRILNNSLSKSTNNIKRYEFRKSNSEMCIYYCNKFGFNDLKKVHEKNWRNYSLRLSFFDKRPNLAKSVIDKYNKLSIKESIWYISAIHSIFRPFMFFLIFVFQKKVTKYWQ